MGNRVLHGYLTACAGLHGVIYRPLHAVYYIPLQLYTYLNYLLLREGNLYCINDTLAEQITHGQEDAAPDRHIILYIFIYKRAAL